jgi:hypothetical protein
MGKSAAIRTRRDGEGALAWLAFLVIAVIGAAALISGAIRHQFDRRSPAAEIRSTADHPSPAPPPLPKPMSPSGKSLSMLA